MAYNRRTFLKTAAACAAAGMVLPHFRGIPRLFGEEHKREYKAGICDWDLRGFMANPDSFEVAKELGFQGVELSYTLEGPFTLRNSKENRERYREAAQKTKMEISSFAMGLLNERPFAREDDAESWVLDCMEAMDALEAKRLLLAFFSHGELKDRPKDQKNTIEKLKRLAPQAEKLGITLAMETRLNAEEHLRIIDAVGSDAVKVYYDVQNMTSMGHDIFEEIETLGNKKLIAQVHLKDGKNRLENSAIDLKRVRDSLEKVEYSGWLVVEGSVNGDWKESLSANAAFVRKLFS